MTYIVENKRRDNAISESRYIGKICEKHPELEGVRHIRTHGCVGCQRDRNKAYKKTPSGKAAEAARLKSLREYRRTDQIYNDALNTIVRLQAVNLCLRETKDVVVWRDYWTKALHICWDEGRVPRNVKPECPSSP